LGASALTLDVLEMSLATVVKHHEDADLARHEILPRWAAQGERETAGP
jgi:hypothetical protein